MQAWKVDFGGSLVSRRNAGFDEKLKTTPAVLTGSLFPVYLKHFKMQ